MDGGTSVDGILLSEEVDGEADEEVDLEEEKGTMAPAPAAIAAASILILELPNVLTVLQYQE